MSDRFLYGTYVFTWEELAKHDEKVAAAAWHDGWTAYDTWIGNEQETDPPGCPYHLGGRDPLDAVRGEAAAKAWDACLDAIEENELNTQQAREGNPYRKETQ